MATLVNLLEKLGGLRCKEKTVGSSHVMFVCLLTTYTCCKKCYGILPCSMVLLSLAVALNNGQKPTQDTEFFCIMLSPKKLADYDILTPTPTVG